MRWNGKKCGCQIVNIGHKVMGFTRTAALKLSELMVSDDYDKVKCMNWFSKNDVHSMDISPTILQEVDKVLSLQ